MTTRQAPLRKFTTPISATLSSDWGLIYNACRKVYKKNVAVSKENKFNFEMDKFIYSGDHDHIMVDLRHVENAQKRPGELTPVELHNKTDDKVALSSIYLRHSEACRKMAWAALRQNYPLALRALAEFSEVEQDLAELNADVATSQQYLNFQNRVMKEYNENKERVLGWKNDGYFAYRFQGRKIHACC